MRPPLLVTILTLARITTAFVLDEITMDEATFEACSTCDSRANFAFSMAASRALRDYMSKNPVRLAIERGDVVVKSVLPNEKIDTGHSCSVTAEARDIKVEAKMVNDKDFLDKNLGAQYEDAFFTTFIAGDVPHQVDVSANVRMWFGSKIWFGRCKNYGRKTCDVSAASTGTNTISVTLMASEVIAFHQGGKQSIKFKLDVEVLEEPESRTYSPTTVSVGKCKLPFNIGNLKSKVQKYAEKYINSKKYKPQVSSRLMKKLEEVLMDKVGGHVIIPVNVVGGSGRRKRAAVAACKRMQCPAGFTRVGNTEKCRKYTGFRKPNCGPNAVPGSVRVFNRNFYFCEAAMVPA